ncbi:MAG TPA: hypothetical protein VFM83_06295, partial [Gaiellaceae bacterium]|nr:hypothetical protein [Gaiellaceae bacterium]
MSWRRWFAAVGLVWALFAAVGLAVFITYWRLPANELYNVSNEGLRNGASRLLVFLNYPVSLAAIPIAWLAADRLGARRAMWAAGTATVLCAVTAWPGVIDQNDLDAKPTNLVPVLGVAMAVVLSALAPWETIGARRLDLLRVGIAVVLVVAATPWIFATLGLYAPGDVFLGEEMRRGGDGLLHPAVHLGEHEGLDGTLLALAALQLSRLRPRLAVAFVIGLMFVYGVGVAAQDDWNEQVVKRGWAGFRLPNVLHPTVNVTWFVVLVLAAIVAL